MPLRKISALVLVGAAAGVAAIPAFAATKTVRLKDDFFSPKSISANKGDKIKFVWSGDSPHDVKGMGISIPARTSGTKTVTLKRSSGTIVCTIHSGMKLRVR